MTADSLEPAGQGDAMVVSSSGLSRGSRDDVSRNPARRIAPRLAVIVVDPAPRGLNEAAGVPSVEEGVEVAKRVRSPLLGRVGTRQYVHSGFAEVLRVDRTECTLRCWGGVCCVVPALI